jgi:CBS domain-containing protein
MSESTLPSEHGSYLMPSIANATVGDAMHPGILSCEPDASLTEVARLMATHHVHSLAVIGIAHSELEHGVWGIVSDLDLLRAAARDVEVETAGSLAQQPLVSVTPSTPLLEAADLMLTHGVSHLVVVEPESQRPIGIVSTLDVVGVLAWGEG